jgi:hypothetical protein
VTVKHSCLYFYLIETSQKISNINSEFFFGSFIFDISQFINRDGLNVTVFQAFQVMSQNLAGDLCWNFGSLIYGRTMVTVQWETKSMLQGREDIGHAIV